MNKEEFIEVTRRLQEVNDVIEGLDECIRVDAFQLLSPYVAGEPLAPTPSGRPPHGGEGDGESREIRDESTGRSAPVVTDARSFLGEHQGETPSDNVYAIAAWWYATYGLAPLDRKTIENIATDDGVPIPKRPDATLSAGTHERKRKFTKKGGGFAPTITGEKWIREAFGVEKGINNPPRVAEP